jgi:multicomponent Na+:H+ antiporter subunit E
VSEVLQSQKAAKKYRHKRAGSIVLQFLALFIFWLILSGHYEIKYLSFGLLSAGLVTFLTNDLFYSLCNRTRDHAEPSIFSQLWRFLAYLPWLLTRIIKANFQVAYLALHPRMPIDPALLQFLTRLRGSLAQVIVANSITLTPGTTTVNLEEGKYIIHVLVPSAADEILNAKIQNKVGAIFKQGKEPTPVSHWAYYLEELEQ